MYNDIRESDVIGLHDSDPRDIMAVIVTQSRINHEIVVINNVTVGRYSSHQCIYCSVILVDVIVTQ